MEKPRTMAEQHWPEIALSLILLVATGYAWSHREISAETAEIIDVITASIAIYVGILKGYFHRSAEAIADRRTMTGSKAEKISAILETLSGAELGYAIEVVDSALSQLNLIPEGTLQLDAAAYWRSLSDMLKGLKKGCHILAVSSMAVERWDEDPSQRNYLELNLSAARRGVHIRRVFLIEKTKMHGGHRERVRDIIRAQTHPNITCQVVWRESLSFDCEDFVLFDEPNIAFIDEPVDGDPTRVKKGYKITNPQRLLNYRRVFQSLTETYCDRKVLDELLA
jgi:hypothetical protein